MAGAVAARSKELLGTLSSQPATANAIVVTQVEALMSLEVWADYPAQRGQPYGLHGRMKTSTEILAALWANRVQFGTARAAAEAYAVAHHSKKRALLLASLTPALRGSVAARVANGGAVSYVVEPTLEAVDRAEYRVRIQRDTGDTVADLELRLRAAAGAWSINWVGPYMARP